MRYQRARIGIVRYPIVLLILFAPMVGCVDNGNNASGPTTRPMSVRDRQDAALKDPFSYGGDSEKVDISGGDLKTLDKKAMKRDLDSFFNP